MVIFHRLLETKKPKFYEMVPFEQEEDDLKKKLAKNNKAKMVLYNALPKKEYDDYFMCKTAKDIFGNAIVNHSSALDEGFSNKNYIRKFIRALHPKWRAKVTSIEESKDLSSLALDELIGNLKVQEVIMEKGSEIYRGKKERVKSIALKAKKEDEKKGKSDWNCFRCGDPNHLIGDCPKPPHNKDQKAFIGGSRSDSENDAEDKTNDGTCLMAQSSNEVTLNSSYYSDNASSLDNDNMQIEYDSLCEISSKIINKNKTLKTKRDLLEKEILELNEKIKKLERGKEIDIACKLCQELKLENSRLKETQVKFVKFDKSANLLREMLNNQKSSSCKIGLGFYSSKASTSGTKPISFVGPSAENATDRSTIHGFVSHTVAENMA
ncbi:zf-CCHC domain-containing protein [Tanacetum coccineum]